MSVVGDELDIVATLDRYAAVTKSAIDDLLQRDESNPWLDRLIADYPSRPGKALRPAILLATCQAFGGAVADGLETAAGLELLHNAFLIHDDIEDASELRRGAPTLHRLHGVPLALNAGDALALIAATSLLGSDRFGGRMNQRLSDEFKHMTRQSIDGQATELGWRRDVVVDLAPDDYLDLIGRKTCWYTTIYPLRVGALIGSRGTASLVRLNRFGFYLGAAFQIRDDLLNLVGSVERYGKELYGDIREGKRTLMLIHLLGETGGSSDGESVVDFLASPEEARTDDDVQTIFDLMVGHGSIDFATEYGQGIAAAAYDSFDEAFVHVPDSRHRRFLRSLVSYMLERDS